MSTSASPDPERIAALDLIRGIAILGILPANIPWFSGTGPSGMFGTDSHDVNSADQIVKGLTLAFVDGKFISQLAMLFGAGLALQADRAWSAGRRFTLGYLWRTLLLLVLGAIHALLLWFGDILVIYSLICVLAVFCVRLPRVGLLIVAVTGLTWTAACLAVWFAYGLSSGMATKEQEKPPPGAISTPASMRQVFDEVIHASAEERKESERRIGQEISIYFSRFNQDRIYREGSYGEQVFDRVLKSLYQWTIALFVIVGELLACFLFGAFLVRGGFFSDPDVYRRWRPWLLGFGLVVGIPAHVAALIMTFAAGAYEFLASAPHLFGAIAIAVVYLTLLTGWAQTERGAWLQHAFKSVGRLALSNYLSQTVICTTIFYSFGFALYDTLGRPATLLVVLGVWIVQLVVSPLYLRWFRIGPVEWVWRSLANGKLQRFLRESEAARPALVESSPSMEEAIQTRLPEPAAGEMHEAIRPPQ
jgi:uncharacterized protein